MIEMPSLIIPPEKPAIIRAFGLKDVATFPFPFVVPGRISPNGYSRIPTMTSNSAHTGNDGGGESVAVVVSITDQQTNYDAYKACNGSQPNSLTSDAATNSPPGTIDFTVDLATARVIQSYAVGASGSTSTDLVTNNSPKTWTFRGSNDGVVATATVLDTQTSVAVWTAGSAGNRTYNIINQTAYRYYHMRTTATQGTGGLLVLGFFQVYT